MLSMRHTVPAPTRTMITGEKVIDLVVSASGGDMNEWR